MNTRLLILLCLLFAAGPARAAEDLVSGVSTDLIQIRSDFTGTDIVVFGAIETFDPGTPSEDRDIVVVVRGPDVPYTVRRRARVLGLWINREQIPFSGMPGYYFVASTRPLELIASADTLERFELGTPHLRAAVPQDVSAEDYAAFHAATIRGLKRELMYWETTTAIEFLSRSLFRARIPVPATVPPGEYRAEVYLFHNGTVTSAQSSPLFVDKTGLEREIYDFAFEAPLAYGSLAVFFSLSLGWLGFALFRQR
jgi:uncharacterized protein (TIGR02186 family)